VIEKLRTSGERRVEEPILYVKMQVASLKLQRGEQQECKKLLEEGKTTLDSMTDVDPSVHASVHWVSSQYFKSRQEFAEFYKSALLFLAYTSVETLADDFKLVCLFPSPDPFEQFWEIMFLLAVANCGIDYRSRCMLSLLELYGYLVVASIH
jgi:hypothetical protein